MPLPTPLLKRFPPTPYGLLDVARKGLDDSMLWDIAMADYGYKADEAFEELKAIRERGLLPQPLSFVLSEVLSLTRWHSPERPNPPPFVQGPTGERGHRIRLFACAILLCAQFEPQSGYYDDTPDSTLARCLESAGVLGEEFNEALGGFLSWRFPNTEEPVLVAVSLLALAIRLQSKRMSELELEIVADWVLEEEQRGCPDEPVDAADPMPARFSMMHGFWKTAATELRAKGAKVAEPQVREKLQLCALLLDPA